jgi:hypothetical protein
LTLEILNEKIVTVNSYNIILNDLFHLFKKKKTNMLTKGLKGILKGVFFIEAVR